MKRFLSLTLILLLSAVTMSAQEFIEHLTSNVAGQGTVTVNEDPRLDEIVNGNKKYIVPEREEKADIPGLQTGKKMKARGYRVQVYFGGSTRNDQTNALRAGTRVTTIFPELQTYTTFEAPNWRCRVGDFSTREEANDYLRKIKAAKLCPDAVVVKSEVIIYQ